ncbi:MAG: sodium:calcium antiporter, partial [Planctomycetota bacterium]
QVSRIDGVILIVALALARWVMVRHSPGASAVDAVVEDTALEPGEIMGTPRALAYAVGGLAGLMIGSRLLVWGASEIAMALGVPNLVIGLTVVAIGTSLPELAAAVVSARKGETDLVIGNIVGSNLFNSLGVIGIPGLLAPCEVPAGVVSRDLPILSALSVLFFWMSARSKKGGILTKPEGLLLLAIFAAYQLLLVLFSR